MKRAEIFALGGGRAPASRSEEAPISGAELASGPESADSEELGFSELVLQELSDEEVVERVRGGEIALFEILMRRHNRRVFRAARSIVASDDEAEDIMQDAYVRAFEHLREYEGRARFSTWLTRIAIHEALARARRVKALTRLDDHLDEETTAMPAHPSTPEQGTSDRELRGLLENAIDDLPEEFRAVFMLRAIEQMSVQSVAECLGIPPDTVKTRFFRARLRLQRTLMRHLDLAAERVFDFHLSRCDRVVEGVLRRLGAG